MLFLSNFQVKCSRGPYNHNKCKSNFASI